MYKSNRPPLFCFHTHTKYVHFPSKNECNIELEYNEKINEFFYIEKEWYTMRAAALAAAKHPSFVFYSRMNIINSLVID